MSSNEWEQGRAYVEQLREGGRTDEQIRQIMLKGGWTEEQVEKILPGEVLRAPPPPAAPLPPPPSAGTVPPWASATPSRPGARRPVGPVPRPVGVTILVVLADIGALLGLIACGSAVWQVASGGGALVGEAAVADVLPFAGILICVGILVVGHFVFNGANWARITFIVLLGLSALQCVGGLLLGLRHATLYLSSVVSVLGIGVCGLFIFILNGNAAREYCTRRKLFAPGAPPPPEARSETRSRAGRRRGVQRGVRARPGPKSGLGCASCICGAMSFAMLAVCLGAVHIPNWEAQAVDHWGPGLGAMLLIVILITVGGGPCSSRRPRVGGSGRDRGRHAPRRDRPRSLSALVCTDYRWGDGGPSTGLRLWTPGGVSLEASSLLVTGHTPAARSGACSSSGVKGRRRRRGLREPEPRRVELVVRMLTCKTLGQESAEDVEQQVGARACVRRAVARGGTH